LGIGLPQLRQNFVSVPAAAVPAALPPEEGADSPLGAEAFFTASIMA